MPNPAPPSPTATSSRRVRGAAVKSAQVARNSGGASASRLPPGMRTSCFHSAITLSTTVTTAVPWMTSIRLSRE